MPTRRKQGSSNADLTVMKAPFSNVTQHPKIPDGGATHSLSRRMRNVSQITNIAGKLEMYVILHPSMGIGVSVINDVNQIGTDNLTYLGYPQHDVGLDINTWSGAPGRYNAQNASDISKWRIVSQAMRLELMNSAEEDDGWYEAIRINNKNDLVDHWALTDTGNGTTLTEVSLGIKKGTVFRDYLDSLTFCEQKGYKTGLLKDLKHKEFKLNPTRNEICFKDLLEEYFVNTGGAGVGDADIALNQGIFRIPDGNCANIYNALMDDQHDMIILKLHCRANTGSGNTNGSRFLIDVISNQEFCYHPDTRYSHLQTENKRHKNVDNVISGEGKNSDSEGRRKGV